MKQYHKIQTVFKRDPATSHKTLLEGEYSLPEFEYLKDNEWIFTEKVDGTNIRVIVQDGGVEFRGKSDNAQMPPKLLKALQEQFGGLAGELNAMFPYGACLYGEGYGAGIQKVGGNYRPDQSFVLFDVLVDGWWLQRNAVTEIAWKLDCKVVPAIGRGTLREMVDIARAGFKSLWGDFEAEGVVARPATELSTRSGERIITKIKCCDFNRHGYRPVVSAESI